VPYPVLPPQREPSRRRPKASAKRFTRRSHP
jgi:hypothetical protein